jgi:DNA-binding MarR family transcriptional regulator
MSRTDERVGLALKQAQQALRVAMDEALRPHGLTTAQYAALSALEGGGELSGAELARRGFVTPQTMTDVVAKLEAAGLVGRSSAGDDRRVVRLALTDAGRDRLSGAHAVVNAVEARMLGGLEADEQVWLRDALRRCAAALGGDVAPGGETLRRREARAAGGTVPPPAP